MRQTPTATPGGSLCPWQLQQWVLTKPLQTPGLILPMLIFKLRLICLQWHHPQNQLLSMSSKLASTESTMTPKTGNWSPMPSWIILRKYIGMISYKIIEFEIKSHHLLGSTEHRFLMMHWILAELVFLTIQLLLKWQNIWQRKQITFHGKQLPLAFSTLKTWWSVQQVLEILNIIFWIHSNPCMIGLDSKRLRVKYS